MLNTDHINSLRAGWVVWHRLTHRPWRREPRQVAVLVWLLKPGPWQCKTCSKAKWMAAIMTQYSTLYFNSNNACLRRVASLPELASTVVHVPLCMYDEYSTYVGVSCAGTLIIIRSHPLHAQLQSAVISILCWCHTDDPVWIAVPRKKWLTDAWTATLPSVLLAVPHGR